MVAGNNEECDIFSISDDPNFMHWDNIDFASDSSAQAGNLKTISADFLSKIWNIDNSTATMVLDQNTQLNHQGTNNDLPGQVLTNDRMLQYKRVNRQFFTDTFFVTASGVSTRGNNCAQIFVGDKWLITIYPMRRKVEFPDALHVFCKEIGVPIYLIVGTAGEQTSRKVKKCCHQVVTTLRI